MCALIAYIHTGFLDHFERLGESLVLFTLCVAFRTRQRKALRSPSSLALRLNTAQPRSPYFSLLSQSKSESRRDLIETGAFSLGRQLRKIVRFWSDKAFLCLSLSQWSLKNRELLLLLSGPLLKPDHHHLYYPPSYLPLSFSLLIHLSRAGRGGCPEPCSSRATAACYTLSPVAEFSWDPFKGGRHTHKKQLVVSDIHTHHSFTCETRGAKKKIWEKDRY